MVSYSFNSDPHALRAQLADDRLDAPLLDSAQAVAGDAQADPALLALEPETLRVQVRQETPALLVVRVGDVVAGQGSLAGDLTDFPHDRASRSMDAPDGKRGQPGRKRAAFYTSGEDARQVSRPPHRNSLI